MKKYLYILLLIPFSILVSSCGFEDPVDEYPTKTVLFTYQKYNRELVVGEGLKFKLGVVFAGLEQNDRDRVVTYAIDPSLVPEGKTMMPSEYYQCADPSRLVMPKGELKAYMPVVMDSLLFVSDPKSLTGEYVIPFRIVDADVDTISPNKNYMVLSLKYLAKQFGYYQYSGVRTDQGTAVEQHYANVSTETTSVRELKTVGPTSLRVMADPYGSTDPMRTDKFSFIVDLPTKGGGAVTISSDPSSAVAVSANGESTYDEASKTFILRYQYTVGGVNYTAEDRMVMRNRIRDDQGNGVAINEWEGF